MSEARAIPLDRDLNVGPDGRMRALAHRSESPRNHDDCLLPEAAAAARPAAPRSVAKRSLISARPGVPQDEAASAFAEPPAETDAWWLSRSQAATFARRRIALSDECARAWRATGDAPGRIIVEFNGASFGGAALAANDGRYELELGDALAQEMADVLDEDDRLAVELVIGRGHPTLAIHPYVSDVR
jgi:hypothetical protein